MDPKSLFRELRRRNIYKVAVTYAIVGWIVIQVATSVFPALEFPEWTTQFVIILVMIGLPISLVFAWAFEITPGGIQRTAEVAPENSIAHQTGKKLNYWIIGLLVGALVVVLAERIWLAGSYSYDAPVADDEPSLAVLPFQDMSQSDNQEWYSDGLTEELLNSLARTGRFQVASRTSSFTFKNTNLPIPDIADSLNVNHILEGSVRRAGDNLRITAQLIRAAEDTHIWSNTYDVSTDSVFAIQQNIAENITSALNVYLDEEERTQMLDFGTRNVEAYELYLRGKEIYRRAHFQGDASYWEFAELATRALEVDPAFAAAYYMRQDAYVHFLRGAATPQSDTLEPSEAIKQVRDDFDKARQHAVTEGERTYYRLQQAILSDNWSAVPRLIDRQLDNPKYLIKQGGWTDMMVIGLGRANDLRQKLLPEALRDPLNQEAWSILFRLAAAEDDTAFMQKYLDKKRRDFGNSTFMAAPYMRALLRLGEFDRAWELAATTYTSPLLRNYSRALIRASQGKPDSLRAFMNRRTLPGGPTLEMFGHHLLGDDEIANKLAASIDARPLGAFQLLITISTSARLLPFEIDATPKLKSQLQQAGVDPESLTLYREHFEQFR